MKPRHNERKLLPIVLLLITLLLYNLRGISRLIFN
nr:MAG TPA: hypothetical protein [Caudoviricetes sp.]